MHCSRCTRCNAGPVLIAALGDSSTSQCTRGAFSRTGRFSPERAHHCQWPQICSSCATDTVNHRHCGWLQERAAADYEVKLAEALDAQSSSFAATHEVFSRLVTACFVCDGFVPCVQSQQAQIDKMSIQIKSLEERTNELTKEVLSSCLSSCLNVLSTKPVPTV